MKIMITYINVLFFVMLASVNISCDKNNMQNEQEFFYGSWDQTDENQPTIAFLYAQGFELKEDGAAFPRFDYDKDRKLTTIYEGSWTWLYDEVNQTISFKENAEHNSVKYIVEKLSNNKIKLTNPNTSEEHLFQRE